jgi:hypothetical protein
MRLLRVSEPMEMRLPETPPVVWYSGRAGSTSVAEKEVEAREAAARPMRWERRRLLIIKVGKDK